MGYVDPSGYIIISAAVRAMAEEGLARTGEFGGYWSGGGSGGWSSFGSADEAFEAGVDYNNTHDSWGETQYKSEEASRIVFNIISGKNASKGPRLSLVVILWKGTDHYFKYNKFTSEFFLQVPMLLLILLSIFLV